MLWQNQEVARSQGQRVAAVANHHNRVAAPHLHQKNHRTRLLNPRVHLIAVVLVAAVGTDKVVPMVLAAMGEAAVVPLVVGEVHRRPSPHPSNHLSRPLSTRTIPRRKATQRVLRISRRILQNNHHQEDQEQHQTPRHRTVNPSANLMPTRISMEDLLMENPLPLLRLRKVVLVLVRSNHNLVVGRTAAMEGRGCHNRLRTTTPTILLTRKSNSSLPRTKIAMVARRLRATVRLIHLF